MKVTRVAYSLRLNAGKYAALVEQARRLGRVRSEVWQRYASVGGAGLGDRQVRDRWLAEGTHERFGVLANAWKETVRDAMADIAANTAAAKVEVRRAIGRHTADPAEQKRLYTALKADRWAGEAYLRRQLRRHCKRGHNRTHNQIVVLTDCPGQHHGTGLGALLTTESDHRKANGRARAKLRSIANNARQRGEHAKADRIHRHNLGTVKRQRRRARWEATVRTETFTAVHRVVDKAAIVVAEDLTKTFAGREPLGRNTNRRLAAWTKGVTAEALHNVSERRGSAFTLVNAAYPSQVVACCNGFGRRSGDRLHCTPCRVGWHADHTPHTRVKQILLERADRQRARLPAQDSSRAVDGGERIIRSAHTKQV